MNIPLIIFSIKTWRSRNYKLIIPELIRSFEHIRQQFIDFLLTASRQQCNKRFACKLMFFFKLLILLMHRDGIQQRIPNIIHFHAP